MSAGESNASKSSTDANDANEDVEVTEETVCVEFCAAIDSQLFTKNLNSMKFLGLDTDQTILQMSGNTFFGGQIEHIFGTNILFEIKPNQKTSDKDVDNSDHKSLQYIGKCDKKLVMKRVFIEPKQPNDSTEEIPN